MQSGGRKKPQRKLLWIAGTMIVAGSVWYARKWQQLKLTPPVSPASRQAGITGCYQQAGPWRMFYRITPAFPDVTARPPLILVHGLGVSGRYMEDLAIAFSRDFRVYIPDLPGFGESAGSAGHCHHVLTVDELADALYLWMQGCAISRAQFVANSFGCQILAALAVRHPEVVERLVLQGPTIDRHARFFPVQVWRDWRNGRRESMRPTGQLSRIDYAKAGLRHMFGTMRVMMKDRIETRLPYINMPTLVVRGSRDPVSPAQWAEEVAQLLPQGNLLTIENGTHTLNYVYPWVLKQTIRPFLFGRKKEDTHA